MVISQKRTVLLPALLAVLMAAFPAAAQYTGIPGDIPPIPQSYRLNVDITPPCSSAAGIPGLTDEEVQRIENITGSEIIYRCNGVTVACLEYSGERYDFAYLFTGEWGLSYQEFFNAVCISQLSPSGRYYAVGGDGTSTHRGPVYVVDLETGMKYCTTPSGVWGCSDWIEGDYLLIESCGYSASNDENWMNDDIENMNWINYSYMTSAEGCSDDFVLYHSGSSWMILPEDRFYNYRSRGIPGSYENGIFFDVIASPNIIPSLAGIEQRSDFSDWIESSGGYDAVFPDFNFRVYVDTSSNSITDILQIGLY
ncbi:MAG: hypothetical protein KAR44_06535 [Candidatus Aegiribacteria sp.]|nr:hypothetical protein [Candidatus Aegiribacteria sp.]